MGSLKLIQECNEYIHLPECNQKDSCPDKCECGCINSLDLDKAILKLAKDVFARIQEIKQSNQLTIEQKVAEIKIRQYALYVIMKAVHLQVINYPLLNQLVHELYEESKNVIREELKQWVA